MRRILIISPHFPPVNAADHQRVRMSLPYFEEFGWEATILAVKPVVIEGAVIDPLLEKTVPPDIHVIRVSAVPASVSRKIGLGNLAIRALPFLWREGNRILSANCPPRQVNCLRTADNRQQAKDCGQRTRDKGQQASNKFDLVYFSTTQFPVTILGPIWKRRFGVPYVVDFQDAWLDDYYERTGSPPPGGKFRYNLSRFLARQLEPRVMHDVSQVISVSSAYADTLRNRYPHLRSSQFTILPFGVAERDFELLPSLDVKQSVFHRNDGKQHWVYVGRGGHDMKLGLRLLFQQLGRVRMTNAEQWNNIRLHFIGTSYAPKGRDEKTVQPLAEEAGVGDLVEEQTSRIPYFEALQILSDANALIIPGSDSPGYNPSKLHPYIFARKPMLAVLHRSSPAVEILSRCEGAEIVTFDDNGIADMSELTRILESVYGMTERGATPEVDEKHLKKYTAHEMTRRHCEVFDRAIKQGNL